MTHEKETTCEITVAIDPAKIDVPGRLPEIKYDWSKEMPYIIAGKLYNPPSNKEVQEYFEKTGNPHPWRLYDTGERFIAFNREVDMLCYAPVSNLSVRHLFSDYDENGRIIAPNTFAPLCGTVGCHAGTARMIIPDYTDHHNFKRKDSASGYRYGEIILSTYLMGKNLFVRLDQWAHKEPKLWGNESGYDLFSTEGSAFGLKDSREISSQVIGKWWQRVAERVARVGV